MAIVEQVGKDRRGVPVYERTMTEPKFCLNIIKMAHIRR